MAMRWLHFVSCSVASVQEHVHKLRQEVSSLRLNGVGMAARNAALQLQLVQMQDTLIVAACFDSSSSSGSGSGLNAGDTEAKHSLKAALARVSGGMSNDSRGPEGADASARSSTVTDSLSSSYVGSLYNECGAGFSDSRDVDYYYSYWVCLWVRPC